MAFAVAYLFFPISFAQVTDDNPDASHYAFANYLGSGIYRTSGQSAAVVNIPMSWDIDEDEDHLVKLRLPLSLGFFDYSFEELPEGGIPDKVGTLTITPGIEYHWFVNDKLTIESYLDLGYGHNLATSSNVGIFSTGISALYSFDNPKYTPIWVNRIYYAGYRSSLNDRSEGYSVLQTSLDTGLGVQWQWGQYQVEPRLFGAARWYFDRLRFVTPLGNDVMTDHAYELGATLKFTKPVGVDLFGSDILKFDRLGFSYQVGGGLEVWRIIFQFPL